MKRNVRQPYPDKSKLADQPWTRGLQQPANPGYQEDFFVMNSIVPTPSLMHGGRHILKPEDWKRIGHSLKLSLRELQITQHIFDDNKAEYIAGDLGISVHTVNTYLQRVYFKLELRSRSQLVLWVLKSHMEHLEKAGDSGA